MRHVHFFLSDDALHSPFSQILLSRGNLLPPAGNPRLKGRSGSHQKPDVAESANPLRASPRKFCWTIAVKDAVGVLEKVWLVPPKTLRIFPETHCG